MVANMRKMGSEIALLTTVPCTSPTAHSQTFKIRIEKPQFHQISNSILRQCDCHVIFKILTIFPYFAIVSDNPNDKFRVKTVDIFHYCNCIWHLVAKDYTKEQNCNKFGIFMFKIE